VVVVVVVVLMNYFSMSKPQGPYMSDSKFHFVSFRYFLLKRLPNSELKYKNLLTYNFFYTVRGN